MNTKYSQIIFISKWTRTQNSIHTFLSHSELVQKIFLDHFISNWTYTQNTIQSFLFQTELTHKISSNNFFISLLYTKKFSHNFYLRVDLYTKYSQIIFISGWTDVQTTVGHFYSQTVIYFFHNGQKCKTLSFLHFFKNFIGKGTQNNVSP